MATVLPPEVSEATFRRALEGFARAVGEQWVFTSEEDRYSYLDPFAPGNADEHAASAAVAPKTAEEVQAVVRVANEHRIPLWTVSTGKNLAYGGAAPAMRGSVVLDLKRMDRILELDTEMGYALVEPGVDFFQLYAALQEAGGKLWMSGPAPAWGSVVGNAMDHGVGYTPYGVHAEQICGLEAVLPDGDIVRTGLGGVTGSRDWQAFRLGYGPVWDGMFTQSNFGVVTKMGVWLMPAPEAVMNVDIAFDEDDGLEHLVENLRPLQVNDTIHATYTILNDYRAVIEESIMRGITRQQVYDGEGAVPRNVIRRELQRWGRAPWSVNFNLFDCEEGVELRLKRIEKQFADVPGARISTRRWHRGEPLQPWMRQEPVLFPLGLVDWAGGAGAHMNFAGVTSPVAGRVRSLYQLILDRFNEYGFDCFMGLISQRPRGLILNGVMIFDQNDQDLMRRGRELYARLCRDAAEAGFGDYRAHISFMDHVAGMFDWNDHAQRRLNERVKDALDPNGVLSPGKQGIWPAAYRGMRRT